DSAREITGDGNVAIRVEGNTIGAVIAGAPHVTDPEERALPRVPGDENVREARAGDRASAEIGRALEVAGHDNVPIGGHGDTSAGILCRSTNELGPLARAGASAEPRDEDVVTAGSGRHDPAAHVQAATDLPCHDDVSVGGRGNPVPVVIDSASKTHGPEVGAR